MTKKPKFMEKIQLSAPKIADMGEFKISMEINTLIQPVENLDDAITKEIIKIAEEKGINDLWLLNKKTIVSALEKQIPKKPILDCIFPSGVKWYLCPACNHNGIEKVGGYCHRCGQALDWSDTE